MLAVSRKTDCERKREADQPNEPLYEDPRLSSGSELSTKQSDPEQSKVDTVDEFIGQLIINPAFFSFEYFKRSTKIDSLSNRRFFFKLIPRQPASICPSRWALNRLPTDLRKSKRSRSLLVTILFFALPILFSRKGWELQWANKINLFWRKKIYWKVFQRIRRRRRLDVLLQIDHRQLRIIHRTHRFFFPNRGINFLNE